MPKVPQRRAGRDKTVSRCWVPLLHRKGWLLFCFTGAGEAKSNTFPLACFWLWNCRSLCANSSVLHPSRSQLSSPRQTERKEVNLVLLLYGLVSWNRPRRQHKGGGAGSASHSLLSRHKRAGSASTELPPRNLPRVHSKNNLRDRKEGGRKVKRKMFFRSGAHHTTRARQTLGSNFLTLFSPQYPDLPKVRFN